MTNVTIPNNFCYVKYALKSVPGLADVGVLHGDGDGRRTPARCLGGVRKKFLMPNFTMPSNSSAVFWRKVILVIFVIFELGPDSESLCNALPSESISCGHFCTLKIASEKLWA